MERLKIRWRYTNKIVNDLLRINRAKEIVELLELPISIEEEIKKESIVKRVHYSTKIEGNSLKLDEVKDIIETAKESHERNVLEVRNYYNALMYLNKEAENSNKIWIYVKYLDTFFRELYTVFKIIPISLLTTGTQE